jgi:transcriptional regulator with XRE-family HTH domain
VSARRPSGRPTTASSGIPELDRALGGLFWGDNVVWEFERADDQPAFVRAIARTASSFDTATVVTARRDPEEIARELTGLSVLDARAGSAADGPELLRDAVTARCSAGRRDLILVDSFEALIERWGARGAGLFFSQCCPLLLGLGAIAHWSYVLAPSGADLRRRIGDVTQCVVAVGDGTLHVAKAVGRPPGAEGSVFRFEVADGRPRLETAPAAGRLGAALRALRLERHLTQAELAEIAGVSPSAISQAERGKRGLSLETLLDLSGRLGVSLDELLRGKDASGYRLARRDDPRLYAVDRIAPLLDDPSTGLRAYALRLSPGGAVAPEFVHKGSELVIVASGLVQIVLPGGGPVLRSGESLIADDASVEGWRNMADAEAVVYWVLRD